MRKTLVTLASLYLASIAGTGLANAQSTTATPKPNPATVQPADAAKPAEAVEAPPQPWFVNCAAESGKSELICSMVQTVLARGSRLRLLAVAISKPAASSSPRLQLSLPHGVSLQDGVEVWVDKGAPKKVPIRNADANGSYAIAEVDPDLLESLRKGSVFNTAFKTLDGKRVVLNVSLNGFTAAFAKL